MRLVYFLHQHLPVLHLRLQLRLPLLLPLRHLITFSSFEYPPISLFYAFVILYIHINFEVLFFQLLIFRLRGTFFCFLFLYKKKTNYPNFLSLLHIRLFLFYHSSSLVSTPCLRNMDSPLILFIIAKLAVRRITPIPLFCNAPIIFLVISLILISISVNGFSMITIFG